VEKRGNFLRRHIDIVWEDVRKAVPVHDLKKGEWCFCPEPRHEPTRSSPGRCGTLKSLLRI
jgi:hypothetical protein